MFDSILDLAGDHKEEVLLPTVAPKHTLSMSFRVVYTAKASPEANILVGYLIPLVISKHMCLRAALMGSQTCTEVPSINPSIGGGR